MITIITILLTSLIPTILIELGVLWLLRERRKKVLWASVAINVLTNVPLNLLVLHLDLDLEGILIAEMAVVLIESLWYYLFTRNKVQAFVYSILCNVISFLVGFIVQMAFLYLRTNY